MSFEQVMVDVIRYLAAFTATEDVRHISAARKALANYANDMTTMVPPREFQALWDVTITVQRHISQIGVEYA